MTYLSYDLHGDWAYLSVFLPTQLSGQKFYLNSFFIFFGCRLFDEVFEVVYFQSEYYWVYLRLSTVYKKRFLYLIFQNRLLRIILPNFRRFVNMKMDWFEWMIFKLFMKLLFYDRLLRFIFYIFLIIFCTDCEVFYQKIISDILKYFLFKILSESFFWDFTNFLIEFSWIF